MSFISIVVYIYLFLLPINAIYAISHLRNTTIDNVSHDRYRRMLGGTDVRGKRVALLQVHFEGNVGDQMETIPLLKKLNEWGVIVDCYLSGWMPLEKRLDPFVRERVKDLVANIYPEGVTYDYEIRDRNYDLLIVTPGPTVNELAHCVAATKQPDTFDWATGTDPRPQNISMAWFGVTITGWATRTYEKQKYCIKLMATREEVSMTRATDMLDVKYRKQNQLVMSGDISFSYPFSRLAAKKLADEKFHTTLNPLKGNKDWALIFSRENNFGKGKGVWIQEDKVHIRGINGEVYEYDTDKVVFGSSSNLEDHRHMNRLNNQHGVRKARTVTCSTVEEMFALVSSAPHVITDRYHPGVASMIVGTKLSLTKYVLEATKMGGLHAMMKFKHDEIIKMNDDAFDRLKELLVKSKAVANSNPGALSALKDVKTNGGNVIYFDSKPLPLPISGIEKVRTRASNSVCVHNPNLCDTPESLAALVAAGSKTKSNSQGTSQGTKTIPPIEKKKKEFVEPLMRDTSKEIPVQELPITTIDSLDNAVSPVP